MMNALIVAVFGNLHIGGYESLIPRACTPVGAAATSKIESRHTLLIALHVQDHSPIRGPKEHQNNPKQPFALNVLLRILALS